LKPGPTRRVDPGLEPGLVEEKIGEEKPGVTWLTRQDPVKNPVNCNPLTFIFFY
jgi:hypothetical protein